MMLTLGESREETPSTSSEAPVGAAEARLSRLLTRPVTHTRFPAEAPRVPRRGPAALERTVAQ